MNILEKTRVALSAALPAARLLLASPVVSKHRWLIAGAVAAVAVAVAAGLDAQSVANLLALVLEIAGG